VPSLTNSKTLTVTYSVDGGANKTKTFTLAEGDNSNLTISETDPAGNMTNYPLAKVTLETTPFATYMRDRIWQRSIPSTLKKYQNKIAIRSNVKGKSRNYAASIKLNKKPSKDSRATLQGATLRSQIKKLPGYERFNRSFMMLRSSFVVHAVYWRILWWKLGMLRQTGTVPTDTQ
jgi:hypothetical protein